MYIDYIEQLPKSNLSLKFIYSVRISSIIRMASENQIILPSYDYKTLKNIIFKDKYINIIYELFKKEEDFFLVSYEIAEECAFDGVRYFELKINPISFNCTLSYSQIITAVNCGLKEAKINIEINNQAIPGLNYSIKISSAINKDNNFLKKMKKILPTHNNEDINKIIEKELSNEFKNENNCNISTFIFKDFSNLETYKEKELITDRDFEKTKKNIIYYSLKRLYYKRELFSLDQNDDFLNYLLNNKIAILFDYDNLQEEKDCELINFLFEKDFNMILVSKNITEHSLTSSYIEALNKIFITKFKLKKIILNSFYHSFMIKNLHEKKNIFRKFLFTMNLTKKT